MPTSKPTTSWMFVTIAWTAFIFFSSTSTAARWCEHVYFTFSHYAYRGTNNWLHFLAEKSVHVGLFVMLAILLWKTIPDASWKTPAILLCGLSIGCFSEFLQGFFPDRDPALRDVLINLAGTIAGFAFCALSLIMASFKKSRS